MSNRRPPSKWVNTRVEYRWSEGEQRYVETSKEGYWYDGPWALAHDVAPVWVAEDYQWFDDDGGIGAATSLAAENTAIDINEAGTARLRVNVGETAGAAGTGENTGNWTLEYSVDGGAWTQLGAATAVRYFDSTHLTNGTVIAVLNHTLTWGGAGVAQAWGDECEDGVSSGSGANIWSKDYCEVEYTVDFNTASAGEQITFRVVSPEGTNVTFTNVPTANITANVSREPGTASPSPTITGYAPTAAIPQTVTPDVGALAITGNAPRRGEIEVKTTELQFVYVIGLKLDGQPLTIDVVEGAPVREPGTASPSPTITGYAPTTVVANVTTPDIVDPSPTITGYAPTSTLGVNVEPGLETLDLGVTGSEPTVIHDRLADVPLSSPSPTITGYAPESVVANLVTPDVATPSPTITPYAPSLDRGVFPDKDDLVLGVAGSEPDAVVANLTTPDKDDLVLGVVGSEPIISVGFIVEPGTDALVLGVAPSAPDAVVANLTTPDVATPSPIITTYAPSLDRAVVPDKDDLVLGVGGSAPTVVVANVTEPGTDALALDGKQPSLGGAAVREPPTVALSLGVAGSEPTVIHNRLADVLIGTLTIDEQDAFVSWIAEPDTVGLVIDEQQAGREVSGGDVTREPSTVGLAFSSDVITVLHDRVSIPSTIGLTIDGKQADRTVGQIREPATLGLVIAEQNADRSVANNVAPGTVALSITGYAPSLPGASASIELGTGSLTFNGQDASIFYRNGTLIVNPDATTDVPTNFTICDYSGFRVMPGTLKWTWRRHGVRRKSYEERHPQEGMKGKTRSREATRGPRRPEQDDTFITTDVDPEDL